ncbi:hypothetical protein ABZ250_08075 [Streptomyces afghaniensis]|uniref:hypothetical protein n=1 Tax=Streptomyces afghaniensis TaxID=66865 RepID=UPI0033BB3880
MVTSEGSEDRPAATAGLWRYYEEHAAQARQHENLRATVTGTLSAIAAAVVGLAGVGGLSKADIPAGVVVIILSALGVALSIKHYERNRMHTEILGEIGKEIDQSEQDPAIKVRSTRELRKAGRKQHKKEFSVLRRPESAASERSPRARSPWVDRVRLHILWLGLPVGIGLTGVVVIILSAIGVRPR